MWSAVNPSKCTHTWSSGQPTLQCPGNSWGLLKGLTSVLDNSCWSQDSNSQPWVTSLMLYPLGHDCPYPQHSKRQRVLSPCVPELRSARGHSVKPGSPVYFTCMEGLLSAPMGYSQACLPDTIPRLTARLRLRSKSSDVTFGHTALTTSTAGAASSPGPSMPRTPSDNPSPGLQHSNAYSVSSLRSSPGGRALGGSSCGLLVQREREGMGLSRHPSPACSAEAHILCRCLSVRPPSIPARRSGLAVDQGPPPPPAL